MKLTMLVCCHKEDIMATAEPYMPLQVGKDISKIDLNIQGDNTGDNISCKNQSYCELTGMYWAWKNLKNVDYVGLCHYRRYFDFHGQCKRGFPITVFPTKDFYKMDLGVPARILKQLQTGIMVMPKGINYDCSLFMNYCYAHVSDDLRTLEAVIHETQAPIYREAFNYIMRSSHVLKPCNMFIMSWTEFDKYCNWLFPLLNEVEKRIDISHYDTVQKRVYGYMAERLLNVYVRAHKIPVNSCPIIWFNDNAGNRQSFFRMKIRHFLNALSFYFARLGRSEK